MTTITLTITSTPDCIDFLTEDIFCKDKYLHCLTSLLENTQKAEKMITDKIKDLSSKEEILG